GARHLQLSAAEGAGRGRFQVNLHQRVPAEMNVHKNIQAGGGQVFKIGDATITRVEEGNRPVYPLTQIFPECGDEIVARHKGWLAPHHYEAETGRIRLSVHSWLLQVGGKKILIDCCCGNNKKKPGRPFWEGLNEPYLERLAAAGARPDEIDMVMC